MGEHSILDLTQYSYGNGTSEPGSKPAESTTDFDGDEEDSEDEEESEDEEDDREESYLM